MSDQTTKDIQEAGEIAFYAVNLEKGTVSMEKKAMLQEEKDKAINETMVKMASYNEGGLKQDPYPSPFLNLSDAHIPRTNSEIFHWCKYFYTFDPLIAGAINALATFPVTEVLLEDKKKNKSGQESPELELYRKVMFKELNIYKLLVEIGIDYYLYGNCFIFGEMWKNPMSGQVEWKNMVRLDPNKIIIDYNPATKEKTFKWQIPAGIINIVRKRKPKAEYDKIPSIIKDAVIKNSSIVLNSNNIYHFPRPTDSGGDNAVWGTPVPANVLKLLMYRNTLRQAQEAIAREHIVPMRIYYLEKTNDYNIAADWNKIAQDFAGELMKTVRDPNYKVVSPVPVNMLSIGGQGRALLLTPEIEQIQSEILAGMGVPREFIFGGVSYSGSSISLRILENQFITYRLLLKDFMQNFVIKNMAQARGEWVNEKDDGSLISVKLSDLKMQDDVQQKQLVMQMSTEGKVSNEFMWKSIGIEPANMKETLHEEALENLKFQTKIKMAQMEAEVEIQMKQLELQQKLNAFNEKLNPQPAVPGADQNPAMPGQNPSQAPGQDPSQAQGQMQVETQLRTPKQAMPQGQAKPENQGEPQTGPKMEPKQQGLEQIQSIATQLLKVSDKEREQFLSSLPKTSRAQIEQVMQEIAKGKGGKPEAKKSDKPEKKNPIDMRAMPEQKPPRRDSIK